MGEGSSKGIWQRNVVTTAVELRRLVAELHERYGQPLLVEEFIDGRELTVGMLGNRPRTILPIAEIRFAKLPPGFWPIDSFEAKWMWNGTGALQAPALECPANLSERIRGRVERLAARAFAALECRDLARLDIRLGRDGTPYVLEINALPGLIANEAEESRFPLMARVAGMPYDRLIGEILHVAMARHRSAVESPAEKRLAAAVPSSV